MAIGDYITGANLDCCHGSFGHGSVWCGYGLVEARVSIETFLLLFSIFMVAMVVIGLGSAVFLVCRARDKQVEEFKRELGRHPELSSRRFRP